MADARWRPPSAAATHLAQNGSILSCQTTTASVYGGGDNSYGDGSGAIDPVVEQRARMMHQDDVAELASAFDPHALSDEVARRLRPNFLFRQYSPAELDIAEEDMGLRLPDAYRFMFENYDGIDVGTRDYCGRRGRILEVHANSLFRPWRGGGSYQEGWFDELRHQLRDDDFLIPRAMQLLPLASVTEGAICLDLAFDADDPPVVRYRPTNYPSSEKLSYVADSLPRFFDLPFSDEAQAPHCELSPRAISWYEEYDALVDSAEMSEAERALTLKYRRPRA